MLSLMALASIGTKEGKSWAQRLGRKGSHHKPLLKNNLGY